jgi:hypothetical protein
VELVSHFIVCCKVSSFSCAAVGISNVAERLIRCTFMVLEVQAPKCRRGRERRSTDVLLSDRVPRSVQSRLITHLGRAFLRATRKPSLHQFMELARPNSCLEDQGFEGKSTRGTGPSSFHNLARSGLFALRTSSSSASHWCPPGMPFRFFVMPTWRLCCVHSGGSREVLSKRPLEIILDGCLW